MKYSLATATEQDLCHIAQNMDPADAAEVWATAHLTPLEAITISAAASRDPWVGRVEGVPICAFGVSQRTILDDKGVPWLLGTPEIRKHARVFLHVSRNWVEAQAECFRTLENFVDSRHTRAVKWLRWLGFTIEPAQPYGPDGVPFHHFHMRA